MGGNGAWPVALGYGSGWGKGKEHQEAIGVPSPTLIRAVEQWGGSFRGGRRWQRQAAALQARIGGLGWRWWPWGRRGGAERPFIGELRRWRCKRGRRAGWDSTGGSPVALCGGRRRCTASTTVGGVAQACEVGSVRLRASGLSRGSVRRALRARARAGARAGRAACVGAAGGVVRLRGRR